MTGPRRISPKLH